MRLFAIIGAIGAATLLATTAATAATGPSVLSDVRTGASAVNLGSVSLPIDGDHPQPDTEIEPSIAVNPQNPLNAVTVFQEDRIDSGGDADNGFATTTDGGQTWKTGNLPGTTTIVSGDGSGFERASDAVVAFGLNNVVYANSLVFDQDTNNGLPSGMAVNVSTDGGLTWSAPVFLESDQLGGLNDKNWIAVDSGTGTGHHPGRVYVFWDRIAPMVYAYCDPDAVTSAALGAGCDKAANWSNAPQHNGAFYTYNPGPGIDSIPLVLPDGSVGVVFEGDFGGTPAVQSPPTDQPDFKPPTTQIMFAEAPAAGAVPFPAPLTFSQAAVGIATNQSTCCAEQRAGTLPAAAVAPDGTIYVAWEDARFRSDSVNDAVFSKSSDGVTWTPAARINPGPTNDFVNHFNTSISTGADGSLHVMYRQRNETPGTPSARSAGGLSPYIDTYYQESGDGGSTWSVPLKVNSVSSDVGYAAFSRGGAFLGDYDQIVTGSNGWSWITRDESLPATPGEPCNCSFTSGNGHQHQSTWVAIVAPAPSADLPESPWMGMLAGAGLPALAVLATRRRRRNRG